MSEVVGTPERRAEGDRRAGGGDTEGRRERKQPSTLSYVLRSLAAVAVLLVALR